MKRSASYFSDFLEAEYDDENQLIRVTEPNAWKSEFTYDGKMRRRIRKEYTWLSAITNWQMTVEVRYVYDRNLVLQERHYAPQLSTTVPQQAITYTRGRDLSGSLEGAGGIGGLLARTDGSLLALGDERAHAYYHADGNGNITALTDAKQLIAARYLYEPYGNLQSRSGPLADENLHQLASKETHTASALVYYLYRYYDCNLHRWINQDPVRELGHLQTRRTAALSHPDLKVQRWAAALRGASRRQAADDNLRPASFTFLGNRPLDAVDAFGLASCKFFCARVGTLVPIYLCVLTENDGCGPDDCLNSFMFFDECSEMGFHIFIKVDLDCRPTIGDGREA